MTSPVALSPSEAEAALYVLCVDLAHVVLVSKVLQMHLMQECC